MYKAFTVRLSSEVFEQLVHVAKQQDRSISAQAAHILKQWHKRGCPEIDIEIPDKMERSS